MKKLVEEWIPLNKTNLDADIELAFKFPPKDSKDLFEAIYGKRLNAINTVAPRIRNLHTWFARRPCSTARILNLAGVLNSDFDRKKFESFVGFDRIFDLLADHFPPIIFYINPDFNEILKEVGEITVVDPMAGGGAIPLEALRLGFKTVASDYNPVAYLVLKVTLYFPAKYGKKLYDETKKEVEKLIDYAMENLFKVIPILVYGITKIVEGICNSGTKSISNMRSSV